MCPFCNVFSCFSHKIYYLLQRMEDFWIKHHFASLNHCRHFALVKWPRYVQMQLNLFTKLLFWFNNSAPTRPLHLIFFISIYHSLSFSLVILVDQDKQKYELATLFPEANEILFDQIIILDPHQLKKQLYSQKFVFLAKQEDE